MLFCTSSTYTQTQTQPNPSHVPHYVSNTACWPPTGTIAARLGTVLNEVKIIESQLRHPNIVRYQKSFCEDGYLFIVMEMVDGASLQEHFNALLEKGEVHQSNLDPSRKNPYPFLWPYLSLSLLSFSH